MSIEIRPLLSADIEQFSALRMLGLEESPESFGESSSDFVAKADCQLTDMLDPHSHGDFVLGAFEAQALVGVIGFFTHSLEKMAHKGTIWGTYVTPAHRKEGIGRSLLRAAIDKVKSLPDIRQIDLTVVVDNVAAKELYLSERFEVRGTEIAALCVNGRFCDEHFMQLQLK